MTSLRFAVIGAGRLGASLALALRAKGPRLLGYTSATPTGLAKAQGWLGGTPAATLQELVGHAPDLYFVTVPDSELESVASRLSDLLEPTRVQTVIHTSGATSVEVLRPCALKGATTLKFHPLQTFADPPQASSRFKGAAVAITPDDSDSASEMGLALARMLDMRPFMLADEDRTLYHAAATLACNYFVTLEHLANALFVESGLPRGEALQMFLPLVSATLENVETKGTVDALTGPLSRGDVETVADHLAALHRKAAWLLPLYKQLGAFTLELVRARAEVDENTIDELAGLLSDPNGNLQSSLESVDKQ